MHFLIKDIIKRKHRRINAFCEEIKKYEGGKLYVKNKRGKILEKYGIIYRYEQAIEICGKIYYPDFVILCDDGTIIIWEHFGLMEDDLESIENIENIVNRIILKRKVW